MEYIPSGLMQQTLTSGIIIPSGYFLFVVPAGESFSLGNLMSGGGGNPRLFEADNTYIYGLGLGLYILSSGSGSDFTKVGPYTSAICEANSTLIIFQNTTGANSNVKYHVEPPTYTGWTIATTLSGIQSIDAISDDSVSISNMPILVGNRRNNSFPRIYRNSTKAPPYNQFIKSDTGIPQTLPTISMITDIEGI